MNHPTASVEELEVSQLPEIPWIFFAASAYRVHCMTTGEEVIPFEELDVVKQEAWKITLKHVVASLGGQVTYVMNPVLLTELENSWFDQK
jgi:hypothetical protein